jgi:hypothetical protein
MRSHMCRLLTIIAVIVVLTPMVAAAQDASWMDGDLASWNTPGMAIPPAPATDGNPDPRCAERERPADTPEDAAVMAEGWRLFLPYQRGWGVTVISALAGYDGMCRPLGYQSFVFVDGIFAGTIAPEPMNSRTDGAASDVRLWFADQLSAEFVRYTPDDPLCCPSATTSVNYTIDLTAGGAVLNPIPAS